MAEIRFNDNHQDLSDDEGFQFEFYCEKCRDAWRGEYQRYLAGTASGLLDTASSFLGGILGGAGRVVDRVRDAGYRSAHDRAFAEAIEQAKEHFHRCRRCTNYFCGQCYNPSVNLCVGCAPSVEEEANVAARETEIEMAREQARQAVQAGMKTDGNVVCLSCHARVKPARFCSECGKTMTAASRCSFCGGELEPAARFCPECGERVSN